ncbi:MAG TPA: DUF1573 domain-containing protein [Arachidicoccus sp.]
MKKLLFAACLLVFAATAATAQDSSNPVPTAKFNETKHNFGTIPQGTPVTTIFKFKNTGTTPLVIESAVASCGCTTPEYPKTPVLAGKTGEIQVTYNAAATGPINKTVTVKFVQSQRPVMLWITGNVADKSATTKN